MEDEKLADKLLDRILMMLGHEQISTTQIYLDIREDDLKVAHRKYVV